MKVLNLIVTLFALCRYADGFSFGAPDSTCFTQYPKHETGQQTIPSPFSLKFTPEKYVPGENVKVEVVSSTTFVGIQTAARRVNGNTQEIVGTFTQYPTDSLKPYNCFGGYSNMLTHINNTAKSNVVMTWKPPADNVGDVKFITTFVQNYNTFWRGVESTLEVNSTSTITNSTYPAIPLSPLPKAIDFSGCGSTKGCFLYPKTCSGSDCLGAATYQYRAATKDFAFELHTSTSDYISIGFSTDKIMGQDATISCTGKGGNVPMTVQEGYNPLQYNIRMMNLYSKDYQVNVIDGNLQCRFVVPQTFKMFEVDFGSNTSFVSTTDWNILNKWYLLLAWGPTLPGSEVLSMHTDLPTASESSIDFTVNSLQYGSSFQLLVQVHGCLMMVAWIFLAGIVTVVARHFKDWLPESKPCGTKVWFQVHRGTAILVFLLTAAGFIVIFVHFDTITLTEQGYTHACVGIATVACVCLQVLAGMLRPGFDSKMRPVFNIGHWLMGHATHILAAATMFLAYDIEYFTDELRRQGFIVLGVWVGVQVVWHIVFEVIKLRRSFQSTGTGIESKSGQTSFNIQDNPADKENGGCAKDACLLFIYILTLAAVCAAALAVFLLY